MYWDDSQPGFGLCVSSANTRTWIWMGRVVKDGARKVTRRALGLYTEHAAPGKLTLAQARHKAGEYQRDAENGLDPGHAERAVQAALVEQSQHTFARVVERFLQEYRPETRAHLSPNTVKRNTVLLQGEYVAHWGDRPMESLTKRDVVTVLDTMQRRGLTRSVNLMVSTLKLLFEWARTRDLMTASPALDLKKRVAEPPRERHLCGHADAGIPSEIPLLWRACEQSGRAGIFAKLLLLTAARRDEVARLTWREVLDLDGTNPRWHLPADRTKTRKAHTLPFSSTVAAILRTLRQEQREGQTAEDRRIPPDYPYVWYAAGTKRDLGFSDMKATIDRQIEALKHAEPTRYAGQFETPWRFHDLRRTVETGLCNLGVPREIRDAVANHAPDKIQATYNQSGHVPQKREALARWDDYIQGLVAADQPTPVRRKRK
jgi:integrase